MTTGAERRREKRVAVDYDLQVEVQGANMFYTGLVKDISSGGLFIATEKTHQVNDRIAVRFKFPGIAEAVEATAVVQWLRTPFVGGAGLPEGIGVRLEDLPEEVSARINSYLAKVEVLYFDEGYEKSTDW